MGGNVVMVKLINITGKALSGEWGSEDKENTGIPVLRTTNFKNNGDIDFSCVVTRNIKKEKIQSKFLKKGDIIIEKSGGTDTQPVGRVVYFENDENKYLFNNFTGLLRVQDTTKWVPKYIFYSLYANYQKGNTRKYENKTTGLHNLKTDKYVNDFEVDEIPYEEQNEICAKLDSVENVIKWYEELLELHEKTIIVRFIELFGDPVANDKNWETLLLKNIGECKNGMNFHYDEQGVEIHCLGVGDFKDYSVISETHKLPMISFDAMPKEDDLLEDGDIVFVRSNGNKALVGRSVAVYPGDTPTTFSGFCIRFRNNCEKIQIPYLLRVLKTESMRKKMAGRGANIQNLNQQILANLVIPVPPFELQQQFAEFVEQVEKAKQVINEQLVELETLKKSLMQKYFG